jgi:hypothetical protein
MSLESLPDILKLGELYLTLKEEGEEMKIEDTYIIDNFNIKNIKDFIRILNIVAYWQLFRIPIELIIYALLNRDEVLNSLEKESSKHSQIYKEDFFYNISLIEYKNEVIDYLNRFYNGKDKESIISELKLSQNYKLKKASSIQCKKYIVIKNNECQIVDNQSIEIVIESVSNNVTTRLGTVEYDKIKFCRFEYDLCQHDWIMIHKFIYYLEHIEPSDGLIVKYGSITYAINNNKLLFPTGTIVVTKYNKDSILKELKLLYEDIKEDVSKFLSIYYYNKSGYMFKNYTIGAEKNYEQKDLLSTLENIQFDSFEEIVERFNTFTEISF